MTVQRYLTPVDQLRDPLRVGYEQARDCELVRRDFLATLDLCSPSLHL